MLNHLSRFAAVALILCGIPGQAGAAQVTAKALEALERGDYAQFSAPYQAAQLAYEQGRMSDLQLDDVFSDVFPPEPGYAALLDKWVQAQPSSYVALILRADYLYARAISLRGPQAADDIAVIQTARLNDGLIRARADLGMARALSTRPTLAAARLVRADGGLGVVEDFPNLVAATAKSDPNALLVYRAVLAELSPQNGGSVDAMVAFIDELRLGGKLQQTQIGYLDGLVLSALADAARLQGKYGEAADFYKQAWAKEAAFDPTRRDALAGYTLSLYLQSIAAGNEGREEEIYQALNTLLQDASYPGRGPFFGLRGEVRQRHYKDLPGSWQDFKEGARLADPFSLYKLGTIHCQGLPNLVKPDRNQCIALLTDAAARGSKEAIEALDRLSPQTRLYALDRDTDLYWPDQPQITDIMLLDVNSGLRPEEIEQVVKSLQAGLKAQVRILNQKHSIEIAYNPKRGKYYAPGLAEMDALFKNQRLNAGQMAIALVNVSLYTNRAEQALGWTLPVEHRAVLSVQGLGDPPQQLAGRIRKLALRSIGISAGIPGNGCVMGYAVTIEELDRLPDQICATDLPYLAKAGVIEGGLPKDKPIARILAPGNSGGYGFIKFAIVAVILAAGLGYVFLVAKPEAKRQAAAAKISGKTSDNPDRALIEARLKDKLERGLISKKEHAAEMRKLQAMPAERLAQYRQKYFPDKPPQA